jgi:biotin operon repressor
MEGWIKLHRKMLDWEWYDDTVCVRLFLHLLLNANYKEGRYKGHIIPIGSLVTGTNKLADELGFSRMQIRTAIAKLKQTGEIVQKSTNKYSILTICNYLSYQNEKENVNQQVTNNQPTSNHNIKKERKKERKNISYASSVTTKNKVQFIGLKPFTVNIPECINSAEFIDTYQVYIDYLKQQFRTSKNINATEKDLQLLAEYSKSGDNPIEIIQRTIRSVGKEFYPLPKQKNHG